MLSRLALPHGVGQAVGVRVLLSQLAKQLPHVRVVGVAPHLVRLLERRVLQLHRLAHPVHRQLERIVEHSREQHFQEVRALLETGVGVGLNEPRVKLAINNVIIAKDLEALTSLVWI